MRKYHNKIEMIPQKIEEERRIKEERQRRQAQEETENRLREEEKRKKEEKQKATEKEVKTMVRSFNISDIPERKIRCYDDKSPQQLNNF